jgi:ribulose-5-phosphate 4-epimerase/fuculose-1-phosphate aldolase
MVQTASTDARARHRDAPTIAHSAEPTAPAVARFLHGLERVMRDAGYVTVSPAPADVRVVLHPVDLDAVKPFRRKAGATFVIAIAALPEPAAEPLKVGYPVLVRALANLCVLVADTPRGLSVQFVTLEQGNYAVGPGLDDDTCVAQAFARIEPLASSKLVIANEFVADLPESLHDGDASTAAMLHAGRKLDALNLLPNPFPLEDLLTERDLRHVKLLYGIGGLSYGNLSARLRTPFPGRDPASGPVFWMSASGGDKSELRDVGRDILLVRDYDEATGTIVLSVPPDVTPRRVSVDAIEHWMIYREHPDVGAIVHVHGWIDGTPSTEVNYPCGTEQLAGAVAELVRQAPDPSRAVVGLRNPGLTITGHDLDEIFDRVGDRIVPQVPMS